MLSYRLGRLFPAILAILAWAEVIPTWVQLKSLQHLDLDGKLRPYRAGDWVDLGRMTAVRLIAEGAAKSLEPVSLSDDDAGILFSAPAGDLSGLVKRGLKVDYGMGEPACPWAKTLCWNPAVPLKWGLVATGFAQLDTWEVAVPLVSLDLVAADIGSAEERERTAAVIHELRVPVYEPGVIFLRKGEAASRLLAMWFQEGSDGESQGSARLAFLRALYRSRPLLLPLPPTWIAGVRP